MTETFERHESNVINVIDRIEKKSREMEDLEIVNISTSMIAGELEVHTASLNQFGIFHKLSIKYDSIDYEPYHGLTIDLEKWREERETEPEDPNGDTTPLEQKANEEFDSQQGSEAQ